MPCHNPRTRSWWTPWPWPDARLPTLTVESEPHGTGLVDRHGRELVRTAGPIGFGIPRIENMAKKPKPKPPRKPKPMGGY